jgi:RimJ/RimL family protein N-acetyltransferase
VRLRPLRLDEERLVWELRYASGVPGPDSPGHRERFRERLLRSGEFANGKLWLAVEVDGRVIGDIEARQPVDALPPGVYELGIALYPDSHGKGFGSDATRVLTAYLFETMGAERVQAGTATWNAPMQRVLEKLGFQAEGTMRSFMPAGPTRDDYVLYAATREEWLGRAS